MLSLNLPVFEYKLKKKEGKLFIWDRIRKKYIVLQPEEWVRQHFVNWLIEIKKVPVSHISLEQGHEYNNLAKRTDILVWDAELKPLLLVECKASHIEITYDTFAQAMTYLSTLKAKYVALSNGLTHIYFKNEKDGFQKIEELPDYDVMFE